MMLEKMVEFVEYQQALDDESTPIAAYAVVAYESREVEFLLYLFEQLVEDAHAEIDTI